MLTQHEKKGAFSKEQVAAFCGVTTRQVQNWELPIAFIEDRQNYYLGQTVRALLEERAHERGVKHGQTTAKVYDEENGDIDFELEKRRKLKAERIWQDIKNLRALDELAPVELLTRALGDAVAILNTHVETIPASVKRVWPEVPGHVLDAIEREMVQLRSSISESRIDWLQADNIEVGSDDPA